MSAGGRLIGLGLGEAASAWPAVSNAIRVVAAKERVRMIFILGKSAPTSPCEGHRGGKG